MADSASASQADPASISVGTEGELPELRLRLRVVAAGTVDSGDVARLFGALYEPFRSMKGAEARREAWAAFVRAEGLRVEDLDLQPSDDVVRALACALACRDLPQRAVAVVVSRSQMTVCRYLRAVGCPGPLKVAASDSVEAALGELMEWVDSEPLVPSDALLELAERLEPASGFLAECEAGLADGAPVDEGFDGLLRGLYRDLGALHRSLQGLGQVRGIRL
ncbi:hypothetical protein ABIA52_000041 [Paenarthrobacter histidinolovorans]|uniref:Uncharacterized protein n=1 Tax=Paenarthrobacter histidinolovorans TaxID=43664 RepID=A0ABW8MZH3_9MICC